MKGLRPFYKKPVPYTNFISGMKCQKVTIYCDAPALLNYSLISVKMDEKMSASITPSFSLISIDYQSLKHPMQVYEPKLFVKLDFTPKQLNATQFTPS